MAQEKRSMQGEFESHLAALIEKIGEEIEAVKAEQEALRRRQERLEAEWESFAVELNEYWKLYGEQSRALGNLASQLKDFMHSNSQQLQSLRVFTSRLQDYLKREE